jgi:hypothetical protein
LNHFEYCGTEFFALLAQFRQRSARSAF